MLTTEATRRSISFQLIGVQAELDRGDTAKVSELAGNLYYNITSIPPNDSPLANLPEADQPRFLEALYDLASMQEGAYLEALAAQSRAQTGAEQ